MRQPPRWSHRLVFLASLVVCLLGASAASASPSAYYASQVGDDSPLAYWRLEEAPGATTAVDSSGAGRTASYTGTPGRRKEPLIVADSAESYSVDFPWGSGISVDDAALNFAGRDPFTLEAWVKPKSLDSAYRRIYSREFTDAGGTQGYSLWVRSNQLGFARTANGTSDTASVTAPAEGTAAWAVGEKVHVVASYDGSTMRLYVNGALAASQSSSRNLASGSAPLWVAGSTAGTYLNAYVDEAAVYGTALTQARAEDHFNAGTGAPSLHLTSSPSDTYATSALVSWSAAADTTPTFTCTLDGSSLGLCASPLTLTELPTGSHTLSIGASAAGKTTTRSVTWMVKDAPAILDNYGSRVAADTPLGYWRLEAPTNSSSADSSGNRRPGLHSGSFSLQVPLIEQQAGAANAIRFPWGSDLQIPDTAGTGSPFNFTGLHPFALEAWVRPAALDSTYRRVVAREAENGSGRQGYALWIRSNSIGFSRTEDGQSTTATLETTEIPAWAVGQVSHLVGTFDGSTMRLYLNGSLVASKASARTLQAVDGPVKIAGNYDSSQFLNGDVDEAAVYDHALSAERITAHYSARLAPPSLSMTSGPQDSWDVNPTFSWSTIGTAVTTTCTLDGQAPQACVSPASLAKISTGPHTFVVTATNEAGSASRTTSWTVRAPPATTDNYGSAVAEDTPFFFWRLEEPSGVAASDSSLNRRQGTLFGPTLQRPGLIEPRGQAQSGIALSGASGSYIRASEAPDFAGTHPFTLEAWVKPASLDTQYRRLFSQEWSTASGRQGVNIWIRPGQVGLGRWRDAVGDTVIGSAAGVAADEVAHIVGSYDGQTLRLYVNGLKVGELSSTREVLPAPAGTALRIGAHSDGSTPLGADLDEIAVYAHGVSPTGIATHRAARLLAPTVEFTEMPADSYRSSVDVAWTSSGSSAITTCKLDGVVLGSCSSPLHLNDVSAGDHSFEVAVVNDAGQAVATTPWATRDPLSATPAPVNGSTWLSPARPGFSIAWHEPETLQGEAHSYVVTLDGDEFEISGLEAVPNSEGIVTYPLASNLADGEHHWKVRARTPGFGDTPDSAVQEFGVASTPPRVDLTLGGQPVVEDAGELWRPVSAPQVSVTIGEAHPAPGAGFYGAGLSEAKLRVDDLDTNETIAELDLEGAAQWTPGAGEPDFTGAWSPQQSLQPGAYMLTFTATDRAGNTTTRTIAFHLTASLPVEDENILQDREPPEPIEPPSPGWLLPLDGNPAHLQLSWTETPKATAYVVTLDGVQTVVAGATVASDADGLVHVGLPVDLTEGEHTWSVRARVPGGTTPDSRPVQFKVDRTPPPAPLILEAPEDGANTATARITWRSGNDPDLDTGSGSDHERLYMTGVFDGGQATRVLDLPALHSSSGLPGGAGAGQFRFKLVTVDRAGNESAPAEGQFTAVAAPAFALRSTPADFTSGASALVVFDVEQGAGVVCELKATRTYPTPTETSLGNPCQPSGASPDGPGLDRYQATITHSVEGRYTLAVTASISGRGSRVERISWDHYLDPELRLLTTPDAVSGPTATVAFDGSWRSIECRLDGLALSSCASPLSLGGLDPGNHDLVLVAAGDGTQTATQIARWSVAADASAPDLRFLSTPLDSTATTATLRWSLKGEGTETRSCSLDGVLLSGCTTGDISLASLEDGNHVFGVTVGNATGTKRRTVSWRVVSDTPADPGVALSEYEQVVRSSGATHLWPLAPARMAPTTDVISGWSLLSGIGTVATDGLRGGAGTAITTASLIHMQSGTGFPLNTSQAFTIDAWVRTSDTSRGPVFGLGSYSTGRQLAFYANPDGVVVRVPTATGTTEIGAALKRGRWEHVLYTADPVNGGRLFVNGVRQEVFTGPAGTVAGDTSLWFGRATVNGSTYDLMKGTSVTEVATYQRSLSDEEVSNVYEHGVAPRISASSPTASYPVGTLDPVNVTIDRDWVCTNAAPVQLVVDDEIVRGKSVCDGRTLRFLPARELVPGKNYQLRVGSLTMAHLGLRHPATTLPFTTANRYSAAVLNSGPDQFWPLKAPNLTASVMGGRWLSTTFSGTTTAPVPGPDGRDGSAIIPRWVVWGSQNTYSWPDLNTPQTVEIWVLPATNAVGPLVSIGATGGPAILLSVGSGQITARTGGGWISGGKQPWTYVSAPFVANAWNHIVYVSTAARGEIYVNGKLAVATNRSLTGTPHWQALGIGGDLNADYAQVSILKNAAVSYASLYKHTLSATEVAVHYAAMKQMAGNEALFTGLSVPTDQVNGPPSAGNPSHTGDPVNVTTGNVYEETTDMLLSAPGLPLQVGRSYNSLNERSGPFGPGWTTTYGATLEAASSAEVILSEPGGQRLPFVVRADGTWSAPPGSVDRLTRAGDGTWVLRRVNGVRWLFSASGLLTSIVDPNGNTVAFTYDATRHLTKAATLDRSLTFTWTGERITRVTDQTGRQINYGYTDGRLTTVSIPGKGTTTYAYTNGRLTSVQNEVAPGQPSAPRRYAYDTEGRAIATWSGAADSQVDRLTYEYRPSLRQTRVTDPFGATSIFSFDEFGRVTKIADPDGGSQRFEWDVRGRKTKAIDQNGRVTSYEYDEAGNITRILSPKAHADDVYRPEVLMTWSGDGLNRMLTRTVKNTKLVDGVEVPANRSESFAYDAKGNLLSATDALSGQTAYAYNARGQLTRVDSPGSKSVAYDYDPANGDLLRTIEAPGTALERATTFTYDSHHRLKTTTGLPGEVDGQPQATGGTQTFFYDDADRLVERWLPSVTGESSPPAEKFEYDLAGHVVRSENAAHEVTTAEYDAYGRPAVVTDAAGVRTTNEYDALRNLTRTVTGEGADRVEVRYAYGNQSRLTSITREAGANDLVTSYQLDPAGQVTGVIDARGNTTHLDLDGLGRLWRVRDPEGGTAIYKRDLQGAILAATDPNGNTTSYDYDKLGRLLRVTDALGLASTTSYDDEARTVTATNARGQATTSFFDRLGQQIAVDRPGAEVDLAFTYDGAGQLTQRSDGIGAWSYRYDARGRLTRETTPAGEQINRSYDVLGRPTSVVLPGGSTTSYGYDEAGRLSTITDRSGGVSSLHYDGLGRLSELDLPVAGAGTEYGYDQAGRLTSVTSAGAGATPTSSQAYAYDAAGNVVQITDGAGETSSFSYDDLDRLTAETYSASGLSRSYAYDPAGNRSGLTEGSTTTTYTYDADNRLLTAGAESFAYDDDGNLVSRAGGGAGSSTFAYDSASRLTSATGSGPSVSYAYDGLGRRVAEQIGAQQASFLFDGEEVARETRAGAETYYTRGPPGLLSSLTSAGETTYYQQDLNGSTTATLDAEGVATDRYAYTAFGEIRSHTGSSGQPYGFVGNRTDGPAGLSDFHARDYDPALGRFTSVDPLPGDPVNTQSLNAYAYGWANPWRYPDPSGLNPWSSFADGWEAISDRVMDHSVYPVAGAFGVDRETVAYWGLKALPGEDTVDYYLTSSRSCAGVDWGVLGGKARADAPEFALTVASFFGVGVVGRVAFAGRGGFFAGGVGINVFMGGYLNGVSSAANGDSPRSIVRSAAVGALTGGVSAKFVGNRSGIRMLKAQAVAGAFSALADQMSQHGTNGGDYSLGELVVQTAAGAAGGAATEHVLGSTGRLTPVASLIRDGFGLAAGAAFNLGVSIAGQTR